MSMQDYGRDLACMSDLDASMSEVDGITVLAHAIFRRVTTRRGGVIDSPDYGFDAASMIDDGMTDRQVAVVLNAIDSEVEKDERVLRSSTDGSFDGQTLTASALVTTADGPFRLVLSISSLSVDLLTVSR